MAIKKKGFYTKPISLGNQWSKLKQAFPNFKGKLHKSKLTVIGKLQPTPRSIFYTFRLVYSIGKSPSIKIIEPSLEKNYKGEQIPHIYKGEKLCLYQPAYQQFNRFQYISDTIIGWISLWLYYYEVWHQTGEWYGGGEHPK